MKNKLFLLSITGCILLLSSCSQAQNRDSNQVLNVNTPTGLTVTPTPSNQVVMVPEEPIHFESKFLSEQSVLTGYQHADQKVFSYPQYKNFRKNFELSEQEENLVGFWTPIVSSNGDINDIQTFSFLPNHLVSVTFREVMLRGLWTVDGDRITVTFFSARKLPYESVSDRLQIPRYTVELGKVAYVNPDGYTAVPFNVIEMPESIRTLFPSAVEPKRGYLYRYFAIDVGGGMTQDIFIDSIKRIEAAGNPSAEDIMLERIPNARDFW